MSLDWAAEETQPFFSFFIISERFVLVFMVYVFPCLFYLSVLISCVTPAEAPFGNAGG
jgi:hypothetical protein